MSNSASQRLIAMAIVAIIALLGFNGYLLFNKINQDKLIKQQHSELVLTEKAQAELQKEYYEALSELEEMRGNNEELNALIDTQKAALKQQKDRISTMLKTEKDLELARSEIRRLRSTAQKYVNEISSLRDENVQLSQVNIKLEEDKRTLSAEVDRERTVNEEHTTARAALVSEKESLEAEKDILTRKVDIASVVKVRNIEVTGFKLRNSGKETAKKRAKSIDGLKICFSALDNAIVGAGAEKFFVRVVDPLGETMAVEDLGSGVLTNASDEEVRYTQYREIEFDNSAQNICLNWQPDMPFNPGEYNVEVYNKGHLAGSGKFSLK